MILYDRVISNGDLSAVVQGHAPVNGVSIAEANHAGKHFDAEAIDEKWRISNISTQKQRMPMLSR